MGYRGLEGLSDTIHSISDTAHDIATAIEDNAGYLHSDLRNNPERINRQISDEFKKLKIRKGTIANEIYQEVLKILGPTNRIPFESSWLTNSATVEM
jgi:ribosome maturation protein Sdo1